MGTMPVRPMSPTVGFRPTRPFVVEGQTIEPSVSVPIATTQRLADVAAPDPELEPQGLRSKAYGFLVCPPRPLQPLVEWSDRILAHSLRFVFPRMMAPASRSFCATAASFDGLEPSRASDPAVVII